MSYYIYVIQNKINNKIYIGQSIRPQKRWSGHKGSARAYDIGRAYKNSQYIHRAMAKYGIENFEFQIIEEHRSQEDVNEAEIFWIGFFQSRNNKFGYNEVRGGAALGSGPDHPCYGKPAHNRLFTGKQEKEICQRYLNEKLSITILAQEHDCHESTIHKLLQRNNIHILGNKVLSKGRRHSPKTEFKKGQKPHNKRFTDEQELEICKIYKSGLSCPKIAKEYSCNRSMIQRLLKRHNISIRSRKTVI